MTRQVEFYFDYGSPAAYLGWTQLAGLAERTGAEVVCRPMLLGGVFKATGNISPVTIKPKGAAMFIDLQRWAKHYGVTYVFNSTFPVNTLHLMRGAIAAQQEGVLESYSKAMFEAMWCKDHNLGEPDVVREVLAAAGLDAEHFLERAAEPEVKQALIQATEEAVRRGVFGAPTFFVGEELFWGQDRLQFVEAALKGGV